MEEKIKILVELWVKWNKKEITGDVFTHKFGELFKKETMTKWREDQKL